MRPWRRCPSFSAAVANNAAVRIVDGQRADGGECPVLEPGGELRESGRRRQSCWPDRATRGSRRALLPPRCCIDLKEARQGDVRAFGEPRAHVLFRQVLGGLAGAGVAEAAASQRDPLLGRPVPRCGGSRAACRPDRRNSSRSVPPRIDRGRWSVRCAPCGRPLAWRSACSSREQPPGEAADARLDGLDADPLEVAQADFDRRDAQVVQRAVLEPGLARRQHVAVVPGRWRNSRCRRRTTDARVCGSAASRISRQPTPVG